MTGRPPGKAPPLTDEQRAFIERNERYICPTLRRIGHPAGIDEDDLRGVAVDALIAAARSYDESRGANEASWVITCIKWRVVAWMRVQPGGARCRCPGMVSLSSPVAIDRRGRKAGWGQHIADDITIADVLPGMGDGELVAAVERAALHEAIGRLPGRERMVIEGHLAGDTYREMGDRLGVSESRVYQIHRNAVGRLAKLLCRWRDEAP